MWYCYANGKFVKSQNTKEAASEWCKSQIQQWLEAGAPRHPVYTIHFNGAVKNDPILIKDA